MNIFEFMSDSPILTAILGLLITKLLVSLFRAVTVWIYGYPPVWCDSFGRTPKNNMPEEEE